MGASSSHSRSKQGKSQKPKVAVAVAVAGAGHVQSHPALHTAFKWSIDGFSSLLDKDKGWTRSRVFEIMGLKWYLKLNPRDTKRGDRSEYVSLKLRLDQTCVRLDTVVEASFKFLVYDQSYGKHHEHQVSHNFQTASTSSGISCMIPLATLKEQSSGFIVNDSCVFGVEFIKVIAAKANDMSETLFVPRMNSSLDGPEVFTWDIQDFFALKSPEYSPEFEIGGHKWFIIIYPSGFNNSGNYLSLFLRLKMPDTVPKNSGKLVEYSICIKDQESSNHRKLTGRHTFSENDNWGWGKFISLETFKDPSNGYLVKTKCCIEAQAAIIGSSKME